MVRPNDVSVRALLPILGLLLAACGSPAGDGSATTTSVAESTTTSAADTGTTTTEAGSNPTTTTIGEIEMPDENEVVDAARADLAQREGVSPDDVSVVRVRQVDWPDSSLGCPEEGMAYTQVVTPGFQILLQAGERVFDYHAGSDGVAFLCASDEKDGGFDFVPPPGIDT